MFKIRIFNIKVNIGPSVFNLGARTLPIFPGFKTYPALSIFIVAKIYWQVDSVTPYDTES